MSGRRAGCATAAGGFGGTAGRQTGSATRIRSFPQEAESGCRMTMSMLRPSAVNRRSRRSSEYSRKSPRRSRQQVGLRQVEHPRRRRAALQPAERPARPRSRRLVGDCRALDARHGRGTAALTPGPRPARRGPQVDTIADLKSTDAPPAPRFLARATPGAVQTTSVPANMRAPTERCVQPFRGHDLRHPQHPSPGYASMS